MFVVRHRVSKNGARYNYFMRISPFCPLISMLLMGASASRAQPNAAPAGMMPLPAPVALPAARPDTPKEQIEFDLKTLMQVLGALSKAKSEPPNAVAEFISGARLGAFGFDEWQDDYVRQRGARFYRLDQMEVSKLETDAARVTVYYSFLLPDDKTEVRAQHGIEILDLKREIVPWNGREKWRIAAPAFEKLRTTERQRVALRSVAYFAAQRAGMLPQLRGIVAATRLRQIGAGVTQFLAAHDGKYAFQNPNWREAIRVYVPDESQFSIPGTTTLFSFNSNWSDKTGKEIQNPAQTVLFYEGDDQKPAFRYDGKAAIGFADGSAKLVTPEAAKTLIWGP